MLRKRLSVYLLPRRRYGAGAALARERSAFLEAMLVVAIIGVLAAAAIESQLPLADRAVFAEAAGLQRGSAATIAEHFAVTGQLPAEVVTTGGSSRNPGRFFERMSWRDGEIVFTLGGELPGRLSALAAAGEETLSFRVATTPDGGRLIFLCGEDDPPQGFGGPPSRHTTVPETYLPLFCRS